MSLVLYTMCKASMYWENFLIHYNNVQFQEYLSCIHISLKEIISIFKQSDLSDESGGTQQLTILDRTQPDINTKSYSLSVLLTRLFFSRKVPDKLIIVVDFNEKFPVSVKSKDYNIQTCTSATRKADFLANLQAYEILHFFERERQLKKRRDY